MKSRFLLYALFAAQLVGLAGYYAKHVPTSGPRYVLETRPVDPRDLLRGDYVILAFAIEEPPKGVVPGANGARAFVRLDTSGELARIAEVAPRRGPNGPWLRATWRNGRLDYGINRYFVQEGNGNPPGRITVEIAVRGDGAAQITRLLSDGRPWR